MTVDPSRNPLRRHSIVMSSAPGGTQPIPGVGHTVAIGAPPRIKLQAAPGGAVSMKIETRSGRDTQLTKRRQETAAFIGSELRHLCGAELVILVLFKFAVMLVLEVEQGPRSPPRWVAQGVTRLGGLEFLAGPVRFARLRQLIAGNAHNDISI